MNNIVAPVTDDAELAKVLEDMNNSMSAAASGLAPDLAAPIVIDPAGATSDDSASKPAVDNSPLVPTSVSDPINNLNFEETTKSAPSITLPPLSGPLSGDNSALESIKKDALTELRPLIDKLSLPPEEKFDTLLLIIRSTDDSSLIPAVHEAAKSIEDESKRAQALLDVIKEIDFFSKPAS